MAKGTSNLNLEPSLGNAPITLVRLLIFDIINVANTIFNFGWEYHIKKMEQVAVEKNSNGNHVITYSAIVTVKIWDAQHKNFIEREDTGVGSGIGDAVDVASKSSVSDALKRALRSMGSQFGNNFYQKVSPQYQQSQSQQLHSPQQYQQTQPQQSYTPNDYASLYQLGLELREENGELIILGET